MVTRKEREEFNKRYKSMETIMESQRYARTGDVVRACGMSFTIGDKIYYNDKYINYNTEKDLFTIEYDIEFIDIHGGYHHWKSWYDGGELILKGDE